MLVQDIMSKRVIAIEGDRSVTEAAIKMRDNDVGCLPVMEHDSIFGVVTDRDIVIRCLADNLDPSDCMVRDICSQEVVSCSLSDSLETAAQLMEDFKVRRLLVLDENDKIVGILSLGDMALRAPEYGLPTEVLHKVAEH